MSSNTFHESISPSSEYAYLEKPYGTFNGKKIRELYRELDPMPLSLDVYFPENHDELQNCPAFVFSGTSLENVIDGFLHFTRLGIVVIYVEITRFPRFNTMPDDSIRQCKRAMRHIRRNAEAWKIDPAKIIASGISGGADFSFSCHHNPEINDADDDLETSSSPDYMVLYSPGVENLKIWWTRTENFLADIQKQSPAFMPIVDEHYLTDHEYLRQKSPFATITAAAADLLKSKPDLETEHKAFSEIAEKANVQDYHLYCDPEIERAIAPIRTLNLDSPESLYIYGTADHLLEHQQDFAELAQKIGAKIETHVIKDIGHSLFGTCDALTLELTIRFFKRLGLVSQG